ncbi:MAG: DUF2809 domain-containing protein [Leptolyngbyaceae cyanobacterium MO_188.B28]|nr:DUF2809 domain-containing protein [Leptolyngbyaceae cyanobacterium MO_188.B28]
MAVTKRSFRSFKYRIALLASLAIIVPLGFITKFYPGPGHEWLNNAFGGVPYEIFWILLVVYLRPKTSPLKIAVGVCLITCGLEFLQLWQPSFLQVIRQTSLGRLVLGNSFSWQDFPYYFIGSALGWMWVRSLRRRQPPEANV